MLLESTTFWPRHISPGNLTLVILAPKLWPCRILATEHFSSGHFNSVTLWSRNALAPDILDPEHFGPGYFSPVTYWSRNILALGHFGLRTLWP